jgi:hypothetical protein
MNYKLLFLGITFFVIGLLMFYNIKKRKPASDETNWNGQLLPEFISFWMTAILSAIVGLVFIYKAL